MGIFKRKKEEEASDAPADLDEEIIRKTLEFVSSINEKLDLPEKYLPE